MGFFAVLLSCYMKTFLYQPYTLGIVLSGPACLDVGIWFGFKVCENYNHSLLNIH